MTSKFNAFEDVTNRIITALEKGTAPWVQPWAGGATMPQNAVSKKEYRGINTLLLWIAASAAKYQDRRWMTFKQARSLGGSVREGSKGTRIGFWKFSLKCPCGTYNSDRAPRCKSCKGSLIGAKKSGMFRLYTVFNSEQCEDLNLPAERLQLAKERTDYPEAAALVTASGAQINPNENRASYHPSSDVINMPDRATFTTTENYYSTIFHELAHWTGHESRCDRGLKLSRFGDHEYAVEELVAEMSSAFSCAATGVPFESTQHAAYLTEWLKVLKADNRAIFTAASAAKTATQYLLDQQEEELANVA